MLTAVKLTDENMASVARIGGIELNVLNDRLQLLKKVYPSKVIYVVLNNLEGSWGWSVIYEDTFNLTYAFIYGEEENVLCEVRTK